MEEVLKQLVPMADELRMENGYQGAFLATSSDDRGVVPDVTNP